MVNTLAVRLPLVRSSFYSRTGRRMLVEFVVGSRPCSEGFSPGFPVSLPPQKNNTTKFHFDLDSVLEEPLCGATANSISIVFDVRMKNRDIFASKLFP